MAALAIAVAATPAVAQTCMPFSPLPAWACETSIFYRQLDVTTGIAVDPSSTHNDHFAISVAGWGDFDGDGKFDILFGGYRDPFDDFQRGSCPYPETSKWHDKAWIVLGSGTVCTPQPCNQFPASIDIELRDLTGAPAGDGRGDNLGWRFVFLGNIDGVPGDEVAVSAPMFDAPGKQNAGLVYVVAARSDLPTSADSFFDPEVGTVGVRVLRIVGQDAHDWLGFSLAGPGDVVGDGTKDLLIGAPSGPRPSAPGLKPDRAGKAIVVDGGLLGQELNNMTGLVADFTLQPGTNCLVIDGAPFYPDPFPDHPVDLPGTGFDPDYGDGARFGTSVCGIGDLDGDGKNEFAIGAIESWHNCLVTDPDLLPVILVEDPPTSGGAHAEDIGQGRVFIFGPSPSGYAAALTNVLRGAADGDWFGYSVSGLGAPAGQPGGDASGDGIPDLLVGAPLCDGSVSITDCGEAYLYSGWDMENTPEESAIFAVEGEFAEENCGWSLAGGGDLNGDALKEFAVGSRNLSTLAVDTPWNGCMPLLGIDSVLFGTRGDRVGGVRVFCGAPPSFTLLAMFRGIQRKSHLGYAICWLPDMEAPSPQFQPYTELMMTAPALHMCTTEVDPSSPLYCAPADGRDEIGMANVQFFH